MGERKLRRAKGNTFLGCLGRVVGERATGVQNGFADALVERSSK